MVIDARLELAQVADDDLQHLLAALLARLERLRDLVVRPSQRSVGVRPS